MHSHELPPLVDYFEDAGGLFAMLVFVHFIADFVHQNAFHKDNKGWRYQALYKHSALYTIQFLPFMFWLKLECWEVVIGMMWLFVSHILIDSGVGTRTWIAKIYRPPDLFGGKAYNEVPYHNASFVRSAIDRWVLTPHGRITVLLIDQIQHATAIWPIVVMTIF